MLFGIKYRDCLLRDWDTLTRTKLETRTSNTQCPVIMIIMVLCKRKVLNTSSGWTVYRTTKTDIEMVKRYANWISYNSYQVSYWSTWSKPTLFLIFIIVYTQRKIKAWLANRNLRTHIIHNTPTHTIHTSGGCRGSIIHFYPGKRWNLLANNNIWAGA